MALCFLYFTFINLNGKYLHSTPPFAHWVSGARNDVWAGWNSQCDRLVSDSQIQASLVVGCITSRYEHRQLMSLSPSATVNGMTAITTSISPFSRQRQLETLHLCVIPVRVCVGVECDEIKSGRSENLEGSNRRSSDSFCTLCPRWVRISGDQKRASVKWK